MHILTEDKTDPAADASYSSSPLRHFSPLLLISRKSFSYGKLPLEPIRLTVVKLDGSSFDITVAKNPTVAQLKQAVEDVFNNFPKHKVSWSHVWAQFCLCFNGQKLLQDQDSVGIHGIRDGDQLQFVRHTSISYNLVKERSEKHDYDLQESKLSGRSPGRQTPKRAQRKEDEKENENETDRKEDENENETDSSDDDIAPVGVTCQCSWAHLWKRLFSHRVRKRHDTNYVDLPSS